MKKTLTNVFIGEYLRKIRINKNLSQKLVADSLDISLNTYKDWENGKIDFTISKLEHICSFYELNFKDLWDKATPSQIIIKKP